MTRSDFDLAATRLLAAHQLKQLDLDSLEHASLEQRRYPLATGWEWHVGAGSKVSSNPSTPLRRPANLVLSPHPQWTPGIGHLRQCVFGVKFLRPRKVPFVAEQDDSLRPTLADDGSEPHDPSALAEADAAETCNVRLSICYSPSYGVPVLWLEAHQRGPPVFPSPLPAFQVGSLPADIRMHDPPADGAPLSLTEIMRSSIFIDDRLGGDGLTPGEQVAAEGNNKSATTTPVLLSRADHPATGQFCWFLHPCETEAMVNEILEASQEAAAPAERAHAGGDSLTWASEWLEAWLMVVGRLVDLQP